MPPLPQNNTARVFYDYVTGNEPTSREHTVQLRYNADGSIEEVHQLFTDVLTALTPASFRDGWRIVRARRQSIGVSFSLPTVLPPGLATFVGTGNSPYSPRFEAVESTFQGRSPSTGRRVDLSLYRANGDAVEDFRFEADGTLLGQAIGAAVAALTAGSAAGSGVTVDGSPAVWYPYMNENYNSYWETRSRRG